MITLLVAVEATTNLDDWWNGLMVDAETSRLVDVADAVGVLGSTAAAVMIAVLGVIGFISARRRLEGVAVVMAVSAFVVAQFVKVLLDRPRPPDGLDVGVVSVGDCDGVRHCDRSADHIGSRSRVAPRRVRSRQRSAHGLLRVDVIAAPDGPASWRIRNDSLDGLVRHRTDSGAGRIGVEA